MPTRRCEGSTRRFDSVPYSVCPARRTNARGIVTVYYHVLVSVRRRGWVRGTRPSFAGPTVMTRKCAGELVVA